MKSENYCPSRLPPLDSPYNAYVIASNIVVFPAPVSPVIKNIPLFIFEKSIFIIEL